MMRILIVAILALLTGYTTGCVANNVQPSDTPIPVQVLDLPPNPGPLVLPDVVGEMLSRPESDGLIVAPAYIEFSGVRPGDVMDTWTHDGEIQLKNNVITYDGGDQLCIFIVNCNSEDKTYKLEYQDAREDVVFGRGGKIVLNDGRGYATAPSGFRNWVSFPDEVVVSSNGFVRVPVRIDVPQSQMPDNMAFRITAGFHASTSEVYAGSVYFLLRR